MDGRRWDNDTRGEGVADGGWIAPRVRRLLDALSRQGWVAENPDLHLLPALERSVEAPGSAWTLTGTTFHEGVYEVTLEWARSQPSLRQLRADVFALVGGIAEGATFVDQAIVDGAVEYHATTGLLDGDTPFKGHGHLLRLRVAGASVNELLAPDRGAGT